MEKNFNGKLNEWAEKAATLCHEIATSNDPALRVDKYFYAFQSPPKERPEALILGINPSEDSGFDFSYSGCGQGLQSDIERMKKGNPHWNTEATWAIWTKLKKHFASDDLKALLENSVYMNEVYFNSRNLQALYDAFPGSVRAIRVCCELTQEVVFDVIRPKKILCLGVSECFHWIGAGENYRVLQTNEKHIRLFITKTCRGVPVYGIPHPSGARGISNDDRTVISHLLAEALLT
jgi:hypothetical protein